MTPNNNLSILPFYLSLDKQNHRKDYAFGEVYNLFSPDRKILPFQIIRNHRNNSINSVILKNKNNTIALDITSPMIQTGLMINSYSTYDVIMYIGGLPLAITTPEGQYYIQMSDGVETWYSEIFTIVVNLDDFLKIEYWDSETLEFNWGIVDYTNNFKFNVYLPTQIGRPDYEFEEEVGKRDGYTFVEKQVSEKTFKFNFLAPEFLCDAMRLIRMSDNILITSKGETYTVDTFLMTPKWQEGGYLAAVEAEFQCDTIIKKIGRGFTPIDRGEFNNDFNNDLNILP
jgi:hypothetical protein